MSSGQTRLVPRIWNNAEAGLPSLKVDRGRVGGSQITINLVCDVGLWVRTTHLRAYGGLWGVPMECAMCHVADYELKGYGRWHSRIHSVGCCDHRLLWVTRVCGA